MRWIVFWKYPNSFKTHILFPSLSHFFLLTHSVPSAGCYFIYRINNIIMKFFTPKIFSSILFSLFFCGVLQAQQLEYGNDVVGELNTEGEVDIYTFTGTAGDRIYIRMRDAESKIDACLKLYDPTGTLVGEHCRNGGIVKLKDLVLPTSGTYEIHASDNNDNDTGSYGLSLEILNSTAYATPINCGDDLIGQIATTVQVISYRFDATAGEIAILQMRSPNKSMESELEIYSPSGALLVSKFSSHLTRANELTLPETGSYLVLLSDYNGNDVGEYGFSFQIVNRASCGVSLLCKPMDFGSSGAGVSEITQLAQLDAFYVTADENTSLVIQVYAKLKNFEVNLKLYDPQGNILAAPTPKHGLVRLEYSDFPEEGKYLLVISDNSGNDKSDYEIFMERVDHGGCASYVGCSNMTQTRELDANGAMHSLRFDGEAGTFANISIDPVDIYGLDPRLELYAPDGTRIYDQKGWASVNTGNFPLPQTGSYTILVSDYNGNDLGAYKITTTIENYIDTEGPTLTCSDQPVKVALDSDVVELDAASLITSVYDNCGEFAISVEPTSLSCADMGETVEAIITAIDDSGNTSTCTVFIELDDINGTCMPLYCNSTAITPEFESIQSVALAGQVLMNDNLTGYYDFSDVNVSLYHNAEYGLSVNPWLVGNKKRYIKAWIDWNRNGSFDDEGETILREKTKKLVSTKFTVPAYAGTGPLKMRISIKYGAYPGSCEMFNYGEVEDFVINIVEDADCSDLPVDWKGTDIGFTPIPGSVCYEADGTFTVTGSGSDIYYTKDHFHYVFTELCGDGMITAKVSDLTDVAAYTSAGIMFRDNLNSNSKNVTLLATHASGMIYQVRQKNSGSTISEAHSGAVPGWLRLERIGDTFNGYISIDGEDWELVCPFDLEMSYCLNVGLTVSSNSNSDAATALFENVEIIDLEDEGGAEITIYRNGETESVAAMKTTSVSVFPNPTIDFTMIDCRDCLDQKVDLSIYNVEGKLVWENTIEQATASIPVDLSSADLPNGQYFISVKTASFTETKKLLIRK